MKVFFGGPMARFLAGLLIMPAFLLQDNTFIRTGMVLLFIILSCLAGKRFRLLPNLLISAGIIFINLLTPLGRVIYKIGGFYITEGALRAGVMKALLLIGLIYLSRFSVSKGLKLPGKIGGLIGRVFYYFEEITARRGGFNRKNLFVYLDELLISAEQNSPSWDYSADVPGVDPKNSKTGRDGPVFKEVVSIKRNRGGSAADFLFPVFLSLLCWALFVLF